MCLAGPGGSEIFDIKKPTGCRRVAGITYLLGHQLSIGDASPIWCIPEMFVCYSRHCPAEFGLQNFLSFQRLRLVNDPIRFLTDLVGTRMNRADLPSQSPFLVELAPELDTVLLFCMLPTLFRAFGHGFCTLIVGWLPGQ